MNAAGFFNSAKQGDRVKFGDKPEIWDVLTISKGSHARIAKKEDTCAAFVYLSDNLVRFENLRGPSFDKVEIVR